MEKTKTPGFYARISQRCWSDEKLRALSKPAQRAWFLLWCWSKDQGQDGRVTKFGLQLCEVTDDERAELVGAGLLIEDVLAGWTDWNMTTEQIESTRQQKSSAGKKGAAVKHGHAPEPEPATDFPFIDTEGVGELGAIYLAARIAKAWPAPSGTLKPESEKKIAEALQSMRSADEWPKVVEFLNEALRDYYNTRTTDPKARDYLASPGSKIRRYAEIFGAKAA